ncbi:MAG: CBS domain-containing protein [Acidobacteriota bacterium]
MKVRELMTSVVRTCRPETSLEEAKENMWAGDCGALPVVNHEGLVTGVITEWEIFIAVASKGRCARRIAVREVAQGQPHTCQPDDDAAAALETMTWHQVRRLPVVDAEGHVRGMLSLNDVVAHAGAATPTELASTLASIRAYLRASSAGRENRGLVKP